MSRCAFRSVLPRLNCGKYRATNRTKVHPFKELVENQRWWFLPLRCKRGTHCVGCVGQWCKCPEQWPRQIHGRCPPFCLLGRQWNIFKLSLQNFEKWKLTCSQDRGHHGAFQWLVCQERPIVTIWEGHLWSLNKVTYSLPSTVTGRNIDWAHWTTLAKGTVEGAVVILSWNWWWHLGCSPLNRSF